MQNKISDKYCQQNDGIEVFPGGCGRNFSREVLDALEIDPCS